MFSIEGLGYGRAEDSHSFYAMLEQTDFPSGEAENDNEVVTILLDAAVSSDVDEMPLEGESLSLENLWWRQCRSAFLEFTLDLNLFRRWIGIPQDIALYNSWFKVTLANQPNPDMLNTPVQQYSMLTELPIQRYLDSIRRLDNDDPRRKALSNCLYNIQTSEEKLWMDAENIEGAKFHAVEIVDVGQGNMNALMAGVNADEAVIFYDFGGGVGANSKTWPKHPIIPSRTHTKLVVLSHWDFDHWAGVKRLLPQEFNDICNIPWWVPKQPIGINHAKFAHALFFNGMLRVLDATNFIPPGGLRAGRNASVFGCNGSVTDRNNSGLAMNIHGPNFKTMLLPGDASYDCIADINWWAYAAMVASHHGGHSSGRPPAAIPPAKLAYSYGKGNTYGHPVPWKVAEHCKAGWHIHAATAKPEPGLSRGNIRLEFS